MGVGNYELRIGIEWAGQDPLTVHTVDQFGYPYDGDSIPLTAYIPYVASIQMDLDPAAYVTQVREIATDVINQGGIQNLRLLGA